MSPILVIDIILLSIESIVVLKCIEEDKMISLFFVLTAWFLGLFLLLRIAGGYIV